LSFTYSAFCRTHHGLLSAQQMCTRDWCVMAAISRVMNNGEGQVLSKILIEITPTHISHFFPRVSPRRVSVRNRCSTSMSPFEETKVNRAHSAPAQTPPSCRQVQAAEGFGIIAVGHDEVDELVIEFQHINSRGNLQDQPANERKNAHNHEEFDTED